MFTKMIRSRRRRLHVRAAEGLEPRTLLAGDLDHDLQVVINEVHIQADVKTEQVEFIELHNRGASPVDLSSWTLHDAVQWTFPAGTVIGAGAFVVVAQDPTEFQAKFARTAMGPWTGRLSNEGETIELSNSLGDTIDTVDYQLGFPWPTYGDVPGPSIQLMNPSLDNELGGSWRSAIPTPGAVNSVWVENAPPQMRQVQHAPQQPHAGEPVTVTALVTDPQGVGQVQLEYQLVEPGDYIAQSDPRFATSWATLSMRDDGQQGDTTASDGIYTTIVPAELQQHRRLVRYRITSTDAWGAARTAPYEDDPQPNFAYFVYNGVPSWTGAARPGTTDPVTYSAELLNRIPVYQLITTHKSHVDSQYIPNSTRTSGYTGSDYLWEGAIVYNGVVYDHINYRARGGVWRYAMGKNMWKFDFERGHSLEAVDDYGRPYPTAWDKLNFSAIIQQGDYLHRGEQGLFESVGFRLFNLAGSEAPLTNYAHFRIVDQADEHGTDQYSGDFRGLYLAIEQPDGRFLDAHGLPDGNLYKIEGHAPESVNNQGPYQVSDGSDVKAFIKSFRNAAKPEVETWRAQLNLEDFYSYQAIAEAIHHYDTADGKNYFYYQNPETNRWEIKVWDLDLTWANNMYGSAGHELNGDVAKNPAFNQYVNPANVALNNRLNKEYQNRVRELRDLLYNPEQTGMLIDETASFVYQPGQPSWVDADRAMWDYNPIMATRSKYTNNSKNGTAYHFYTRAATKDYPGMIKIMKDYVVSRGAFMDCSLLTNEANIPSSPAVTYTGQAGYPVDGLTFQASDFASPIGATFSAMQWRIAEVTDPNAPGFNPYDATTPRKYEIQDTWHSDEITAYTSSMQIPAERLAPGKTYRVRVRMKDNDGHWSHWSEPAQFISGAAVGTGPMEGLRVTEVNYHPFDPTAQERAAGFMDGDDFEFLEITNISSATVSLAGVTLDAVDTPAGVQGVSFAFADGSIRELGPGQHVLVVENPQAFALRYGNGLPVAGSWSGKLDNSSEQLTLSAYGTVIQQFIYSDAWYPSTDGEGPTLVSADPTATDLALWSQSFGWRASSEMGGTPGRGSTTNIPGDANRDGVFNSSDLVQVFQLGHYEDQRVANSSWEQGDWNNDQEFNTSDLVAAFQYGAYVAGARRISGSALTGPSARDLLFADWSLALGETEQRLPRKLTL